MKDVFFLSKIQRGINEQVLIWESASPNFGNNWWVFSGIAPRIELLCVPISQYERHQWENEILKIKEMGTLTHWNVFSPCFRTVWKALLMLLPQALSYTLLINYLFNIWTATLPSVSRVVTTRLSGHETNSVTPDQEEISADGSFSLPEVRLIRRSREALLENKRHALDQSQKPCLKK